MSTTTTEFTVIYDECELDQQEFQSLVDRMPDAKHTAGSIGKHLTVETWLARIAGDQGPSWCALVRVRCWDAFIYHACIAREDPHDPEQAQRQALKMLAGLRWFGRQCGYGVK